MKAIKIITHSLFLTFFAVGFCACKATNQAGSAVVDNGGAAPSNPEKKKNLSSGRTEAFLATEFEPLSNWMDERFQVTYRSMTPEMIFDQVPLNDIHYNTTNLPNSAPAFDYESENISRRELLNKIATHWNLKMTYVKGDDGNPTAVNVSG